MLRTQPSICYTRIIFVRKEEKAARCSGLIREAIMAGRNNRVPKDKSRIRGLD